MNNMKFSYAPGLDEQEEKLVLAFNELVSEYRENKSNSKEYKEHNAKFTEAFVKHCVEAAGKTYTGLDMVKNPQLSIHNSRFVETFNTVLAQMITPAVPEVTSQNYNELYDVTQVGFGDVAKFEVESNEYFIVYDINFE